MILEASHIENRANLTTGVCIVGSGAAGITLALELSRNNVPTIVLAGGRKRESSSDRDLYRGVADSTHPHEPLEENRRRAFGGTTIAWGGRCVPLEPIDFQRRAWIPNSGWPIAYSEVLPYFERAMELCEAGPFCFDAAETFTPERAPMIHGFDGPEITTSRLERWSPPTNFAKRYASDLRKASSLRVLLDGHAIHIQLQASGRSVSHVQASARPGHEFSVHARFYVLAAGGLENPRLLLCSNDIHTKGIGNSTDLVGRFYMSHLASAAQKVSIAERGPAFRPAFEKDQSGVYCRRRFALTPFAQITRELGNAVAVLHRPTISNATHRDPLFSATFLVKYYSDLLRRKHLGSVLDELRASRETQREHWKVIAHTSPASAASLLRVFHQRYLSKRRLPSVLGPQSAAEQYLSYQTEHAPNRDSQVSLSDERDSFGMRRITVRVAFCEVDFRTVVELHRTIAMRLDSTRTGSLAFDEIQLREHMCDYIKHFNSQAHHLGTTRMSESPDRGVVDANCKVHNLDDLFVMGGSVFPTGGHANPTLTIVALSVRLAAHLGERLMRY
jgi:choline dehydrogenase-like flavoprotein